MKESKLYKLFGTNTKRELEGVDVCVGSDKDTDPVFVVARAGGHNTDYLKALTQQYTKSSPQLRSAVTPEEDRKLLIELYYRNVIKSWRNVTDAKGNDMAFTKDNMVKLFTDLPDLWDFLRTVANDVSRFQEEFAEETVKK